MRTDDQLKTDPRVPLTAGAPFTRIGIVGLGLIGGSIAMGTRRLWPDAFVVGVDRGDVLEDAQRAEAIDVVASELGVLADVEVVFLAAPVVTNIALLRELPEAISGRALITDVGSTKRAIAAAAVALPERLTFIGGHPLAGAARAGILSASPDLFRGRPWVLTPDARTPSEDLARLERFVEALGARPRSMTPVEHDTVAGWVSHLPQLTASALMRVVGDAVGEDGLALSGSGLRDTTRLASSPAAIWIDVCETNRGIIGAALDRLIGELQHLRESLGHEQDIEALFAAAAKWRDRLPE